MAKQGSVAPKERINIKFVPATGDRQEAVELPMKTVVLGDFTGRADDSPIEERRAVSIDKNNFNKVFKEMGVTRDLEVRDALGDDPEATIRVSLKFENMKDFTPDEIVKNVPELKTLVELRDALTALKGPLGNMPDFRRALAELIDDADKRDAITTELGKSELAAEKK